VSFTKVALVIEYEGTRYHGFQWQVNKPTIQNELEQAIRRLDSKASRVMAASRTDAGVHAKGQVVSFWTRSTLSESTLVKALNYYLPNDIAVKVAYNVDANFNVRHDALSREYNYYILNSDTPSPLSRNFALLVTKELDIEAMNKACYIIKGEHDFTSFASSLFASSLDGIRGTVRTIYEAKIMKQANVVIFRIVANSFLPHQVRNTVGLLIRLGLGKKDVEYFRSVIEAKNLGLAGPVAPAHGLCLMKVNYPKPLGEQR
jgi:tRNA pseudouridine38-40 synthase